MEDNYSTNLDLEFKRYLQILRPYLGQLIDADVISICNAWVQRLSNCNESEKPLRNKYVFSLCYQLAKGMLEEPFLNCPPRGSLLPISESLISEDSSTEVECFVINAEDHNTDVLFDGKHNVLTDTEYLSQGNDYTNTKAESQEDDSDRKSSNTGRHKHIRKQTVTCYTCPEILRDFMNYDSTEVYESRANNLIKKLREIKTQNTLLHSELLALKEESSSRHQTSYNDDNNIKIDHATSALVQSNESSATLKSLKYKLQEVQDSRNCLIEKIAALQDRIDHFDDIKKHEIEEIEAVHKLEVIKLKTTIRDEVKSMYEKKIEDLKMDYELKIDGLKSNSSKDILTMVTTKDQMIDEKEQIIKAKNTEITKLNHQIDELKTHLHAVLEKFIEKPSSHQTCDDNNLKTKSQLLEKKLHKMEKNRVKCTRIYEAKLAQLQREKHLAECTLQLQMVRQRAQVVNEVTDENQTELTTALDKLETKYKEIVANVQATAIQRLMQDQMALESIMQAACGIPSENNNSPGTNGQFSKTMRNQNLSCDSGMSPLTRGNKVGSVCMGNKSFGEDSLVTGYCLNGERMAELFERVYIPQRDNPDAMK